MLNQIKVLLGITDSSKDQLLTILIDHALNEASNYTHSDYSLSWNNIICAMVIWKYNRLGTEGVTSETYSGVSFDYSDEYPEPLLKQLNAFRKIVMI